VAARYHIGNKRLAVPSPIVEAAAYAAVTGGVSVQSLSAFAAAVAAFSRAQHVHPAAELVVAIEQDPRVVAQALEMFAVMTNSQFNLARVSWSTLGTAPAVYARLRCHAQSYSVAASRVDVVSSDAAPAGLPPGARHATLTGRMLPLSQSVASAPAPTCTASVLVHISLVGGPTVVRFGGAHSAACETVSNRKAVHRDVAAVVVAGVSLRGTATTMAASAERVEAEVYRAQVGRVAARAGLSTPPASDTGTATSLSLLSALAGGSNSVRYRTPGALPSMSTMVAAVSVDMAAIPPLVGPQSLSYPLARLGGAAAVPPALLDAAFAHPVCGAALAPATLSAQLAVPPATFSADVRAIDEAVTSRGDGCEPPLDDDDSSVDDVDAAAAEALAALQDMEHVEEEQRNEACRDEEDAMDELAGTSAITMDPGQPAAATTATLASAHGTAASLLAVPPLPAWPSGGVALGSTVLFEAIAESRASPMSVYRHVLGLPTVFTAFPPALGSRLAGLVQAARRRLRNNCAGSTATLRSITRYIRAGWAYAYVRLRRPSGVVESLGDERPIFTFNGDGHPTATSKVDFAAHAAAFEGLLLHGGGEVEELLVTVVSPLQRVLAATFPHLTSLSIIDDTFGLSRDDMVLFAAVCVLPAASQRLPMMLALMQLPENSTGQNAKRKLMVRMLRYAEALGVEFSRGFLFDADIHSRHAVAHLTVERVGRAVAALCVSSELAAIARIGAGAPVELSSKMEAYTALAWNTEYGGTAAGMVLHTMALHDCVRMFVWGLPAEPSADELAVVPPHLLVTRLHRAAYAGAASSIARCIEAVGEDVMLLFADSATTGAAVAAVKSGVAQFTAARLARSEQDMYRGVDAVLKAAEGTNVRWDAVEAVLSKARRTLQLWVRPDTAVHRVLVRVLSAHVRVCMFHALKAMLDKMISLVARPTAQIIIKLVHNAAYANTQSAFVAHRDRLYAACAGVPGMGKVADYLAQTWLGTATAEAPELQHLFPTYRRNMPSKTEATTNPAENLFCALKHAHLGGRRAAVMSDCLRALVGEPNDAPSQQGSLLSSRVRLAQQASADGKLVRLHPRRQRYHRRFMGEWDRVHACIAGHDDASNAAVAALAASGDLTPAVLGDGDTITLVSRADALYRYKSASGRLYNVRLSTSTCSCAFTSSICKHTLVLRAVHSHVVHTTYHWNDDEGDAWQHPRQGFFPSSPALSLAMGDPATTVTHLLMVHAPASGAPPSLPTPALMRSDSVFVRALAAAARLHARLEVVSARSIRTVDPTLEAAALGAATGMEAILHSLDGSLAEYDRAATLRTHRSNATSMHGVAQEVVAGRKRRRPDAVSGLDASTALAEVVDSDDEADGAAGEAGASVASLTDGIAATFRRHVRRRIQGGNDFVRGGSLAATLEAGIAAEARMSAALATAATHGVAASPAPASLAARAIAGGAKGVGPAAAKRVATRVAAGRRAWHDGDP